MANASKRASKPLLAVVVPCYNEEQVLPLAAAAMSQLLAKLRSKSSISSESFICFVDDGSKDATWDTIENLAKQSRDFRGLKLSRNFGHQSAVLAGMLELDFDIVVSIDADLQDDETKIEDMVDAYLQGAEVVYGVRGDRSSDTAFKRMTAEGYYKLLNLLGVPVIYNHADYRLLSKRAVELLKTYGERNLFLRGVVPMVGLKAETVTYARKARAAGESKYPLRKMAALAWQGVTSFSIVPLRFASTCGVLLAMGSMMVGAWALYARLFGSGVVPGWASTVIPLYFLGGIQLFFLGIIGEYIGKVYLEVKQRPRFIVERTTGG